MPVVKREHSLKHCNNGQVGGRGSGTEIGGHRAAGEVEMGGKESERERERKRSEGERGGKREGRGQRSEREE